MNDSIGLKSIDDIKRIREAGRIIAKIFKVLNDILSEGLSTMELDEFIEKIILKSKARPSFKTLNKYN